MFKKSCIFIFALVIAGFAGGEKNEEVALADLISSPEKYLDKTIQTVATVEHVCKHGSKKMLVFTGTPEQSIHVMGSDTVPVFDAGVNGSDIWLVGTVKENRITKAQVLKMISEEEAAKEKGNAKPSMVQGEGPGHGSGNPVQEKPAECGDHPLLKEMEASGKDYVSQYFIECLEYKLKK